METQRAARSRAFPKGRGPGTESRRLAVAFAFAQCEKKVTEHAAPRLDLLRRRDFEQRGRDERSVGAGRSRCGEPRQEPNGKYVGFERLTPLREDANRIGIARGGPKPTAARIEELVFEDIGAARGAV